MKLAEDQVKSVVEYLGPGYFSLRLASRKYCTTTSDVDILDQIIRYYCVNVPEVLTDLLLNRRLLLESLGRLPLTCTNCKIKMRTRHMSRHKDYGYMCCACVHNEICVWLQGCGKFDGSKLNPIHNGPCLLQLQAQITYSGKGLLQNALDSIRTF